MRNNALPYSPSWLPAWMAVGMLLVACTGAPQEESSTTADGPPQESATIEAAEKGFASPDDKIHYYLERLSDRNYTETYGGEEHARTWYAAAEELGGIGEPAVLHLVQYLDSNDPWELKLALYALMLASQDPAVTARTNGDYVRLGTVLDENENAANRAIARDWWQRWSHLWQE
ncbi:HEAT repeat domain-containing protein [Thioalkalivibrio sp. ALJ1]|uniref:HEAT repeat domain-containing protein n=1 Tax=Thioalkalivibrio sp. ALJ1 TaxID=1158144 RepID=UPI001FCB53B9|nr:HEAT repeat domain-containing protein [Thioalkalivibrio sp. ALJ1]